MSVDLLLQTQKILSDNSVETSISYDKSINQHVLDLCTQAKSNLHITSELKILGRYNTCDDIELNYSDETETQNTLKRLCRCFNDALYGRGFGNAYWFTLCEKLNIKIEIYI